jgi:hypothetical protein
MITRVVETASLSWRRDGLFVAGLLVAHEGMKRFLVDGGLVAALLTPGGAHSMFTLLLALLLVLVRFALIVAIPAVLLGKAFEQCAAAVASQVRRARE